MGDNLIARLIVSIITSEYRRPIHIRNAGESSTDQHTRGTTADYKFYDAFDTINTKKVACIVQDPAKEMSQNGH